MKVKDLKEKLKEFNDEDEVILSCDAEGNNYSPLSDFWEAKYVADESWGGGGAYYKKLTPELEDSGFTEEDILAGEDGVDAVVLFPAD